MYVYKMSTDHIQTISLYPANNMEDISTTTSEVAMTHKFYKREGIHEQDFPEFCSYGPVRPEDPYKWVAVVLGPPGSPYEDGAFSLSIDLSQDYPWTPPKVKFSTKIFHPNIDEDGTIYVDILEEGQWNPIQTIESVLVSLYSLLMEPEPVYSFNDRCDLYQNNLDEFHKIAMEWTKTYAMEYIDQEDRTS